MALEAAADGQLPACRPVAWCLGIRRTRHRAPARSRPHHESGGHRVGRPPEEMFRSVARLHQHVRLPAPEQHAATHRIGCRRDTPLGSGAQPGSLAEQAGAGVGQGDPGSPSRDGSEVEPRQFSVRSAYVEAAGRQARDRLSSWRESKRSIAARPEVHKANC